MRQMGSPQQKPKMMQIVCDVSGSMYRFNGHDGRLMREMEAMAMFMEALENYEQKIKVGFYILMQIYIYIYYRHIFLNLYLFIYM